MMMQNTPFHSYIAARRLSSLANSEALLPVFASSSIGIYPYQIAAARFAMRSHYIKGCILCDEGSLGKTYEALLIAAQRWYEGKTRILVVLPLNLVRQWIGKIENSFTLPYTLWNSENNNKGRIPDADGLIITTYDFAVRHAEAIGGRAWDLVIFDEADALFKPENKTVIALKAATGAAFKLLLTPTPITMSVMDIYGLIHFIDESVLPEADDFYKRYFRKPENYPELTAWVSQFAFRTLKSQVTEYVNFTERLPIMVDYELTPAEKKLYAKVEAYLSMLQKAAYPTMDGYELSLMFYHILSSSPEAFCRTIDGAMLRLGEDREKAQLAEIRGMAEAVGESGKMKALCVALKSCFSHMKRLKLPQKAVVFTDNLITLNILTALLDKQGYTVITNSTPYYAEIFREEKAAVLIATDSAAKGLDMEFCPVVINYDFLYNVVEIEQRISRCHRQGQSSDVVVVNLLSKQNLSDVRILELINKRVLQFDGIFGMSDAIVGNFNVGLDDVLSRLRKPNDITEAFDTNLAAHEAENKRRIAHAEDSLFTSFTKAVADKVTVTPQYIESEAAAINADLWQLVRHYFAQREDYEIDDDVKTITLIAEEPPELFTYATRTRNNNRYIGKKKYSMDKNFKPHFGRIALTTPLATGLMSNAACADRGTITVDADIEPCQIGLYVVSIVSNRTWLADYDVLIGITKAGELLTDEQCKAILEMPVVDCTEDGQQTESWLRGVTDTTPRHELDTHVPKQDILERYIRENGSAQAEEIERIKLRAMRKKTVLEHTLDDIRAQVKAIKNEQSAQAHDRMKALAIGKKLKELEKELRGKEQNLYFDQMRVDVAAEEEIAAISAMEKYDVRIRQHFVVRIGGKTNER